MGLNAGGLKVPLYGILLASGTLKPVTEAGEGCYSASYVLHYASVNYIGINIKKYDTADYRTSKSSYPTP